MKIACNKCFRTHERMKNGKCPNVSNTNIYVNKNTQKHYNSYQWKKTKQEVIDKQFGLCIISKALFDIDNTHRLNTIEEVHHIISVEKCLASNREHLIYDVNNCLGISRNYHKEIHKYKLDSIDKIEQHYKINLKKYL